MGLALSGTLLTVAGCSSSSSSKPAAGSSPTAAGSTPAPSTTAAQSPLRAQVVQRLKLAPLFAGATPAGAAVYQTDAEAIAANPNNDEYQATIRKFDKEGMREFGSQHLKVASTADAIVTVLAFGTSDDAALAVKALPDNGEQSTAFNVAAVPGAVGTDFLANGAVAGRNVYFHVGSYAYIVGFAPTSPPATGQPSQETMASAAAAWYRSVKPLG